jgi:hypothetical protein
MRGSAFVSLFGGLDIAYQHSLINMGEFEAQVLDP